MLAEQSKQLNLEIPPFVAVGGGSVGPGFLGMTYAPFVVAAVFYLAMVSVIEVLTQVAHRSVKWK
jgi:hypothetical protein